MARLTKTMPMPLRLWAAALLLMIVGRLVLFTTYRVVGSSMVTSLVDGDRILVGMQPWLSLPLRSGDTAVFRIKGEVLVKRVMACPGDTIAMLDGRVLRNGTLVNESIPEHRNSRVSFPEYALRPDEYFMLGDNRRVSVDSRDFGPIPSAQVLGKAYLRFQGGNTLGASTLDQVP